MNLNPLLFCNSTLKKIYLSNRIILSILVKRTSHFCSAKELVLCFHLQPRGHYEGGHGETMELWLLMGFLTMIINYCLESASPKRHQSNQASQKSDVFFLGRGRLNHNHWHNKSMMPNPCHRFVREKHSWVALHHCERPQATFVNLRITVRRLIADDVNDDTYWFFYDECSNTSTCFFMPMVRIQTTKRGATILLMKM